MGAAVPFSVRRPRKEYYRLSAVRGPRGEQGKRLPYSILRSERNMPMTDLSPQGGTGAGRRKISVLT